MYGAKRWIGMVVVFCCFCLSNVYGAEKTFTGTGEFVMTVGDSADQAEQMALEAAKRHAVEQSVIYLTSGTTVENNVVISDDISVLSRGRARLVPDSIVRQVFPLNPNGGQKKLVLTAQFIIESASAEELARAMENKEQFAAYKKTQQEYDRLLSENQQMKIQVINQARKKYQKEHGISVQLLGDTVNGGVLRTAKDFNAQGAWSAFNGNFEKALLNYAKSLELDPYDSMVYKNLGYTYKSLKQNTKAIQAFNQAIECDPADVNAYYGRAKIEEIMGDKRRAAETLREALSILPVDDISRYRVRGRIYLNLEEYPQAVAEYTQAIAHNPKDGVAYGGRGCAYAELGRDQLAIADLTNGIRHEFLNVPFYLRRAAIYDKLGQYDLARADYKRAIDWDPDVKDSVPAAYQ